MNKILIISNDIVAQRMAGPGIRCLEFARALREHCAVTLATPNQADFPPPEGVTFYHYDLDAEKLRRAAEGQDVIIHSGLSLSSFPFLTQMGIPTVLDIYDPFHLENLQFLKYREPEVRLADHGHVLALLSQQLQLADFFLCASEKQRDFWLGMLSALNRINPATYGDDPSVRRLLAVVPFGIPAQPPQATCAMLKGVYPGIEADDRVILWGGGVYNWFDPLTLIRAVGDLVPEIPKLRLFFLGVKHPNPYVRGFEMIDQAFSLSKKLGLYNKHVFFNDWVAYEDRQNFLLEADVGVSLHHDHLETAFSFRTRILDYIWAGLPVLATEGDTMAEVIRARRLGRVVAPEDLAQVRSALATLLGEPGLRERLRPNFEAARQSLAWPVVVQPLIEFCRAPYLAADRAQAASATAALPPLADIPAQTSRQLIAKGLYSLRHHGVYVTWLAVRNYFRFWRASSWRPPQTD